VNAGINRNENSFSTANKNRRFIVPNDLFGFAITANNVNGFDFIVSTILASKSKRICNRDIIKQMSYSKRIFFTQRDNANVVNCIPMNRDLRNCGHCFFSYAKNKKW